MNTQPCRALCAPSHPAPAQWESSAMWAAATIERAVPAQDARPVIAAVTCAA
ncbi:hypothetical protein ACW9HL_17625 [Nocardia gipuzkoensis]